MNEQAIHKKNKNIMEIPVLIGIITIYFLIYCIKFNFIDPEKNTSLLSIFSKETINISLFQFSLTPYVISTFLFSLFGWLIPSIKLNKKEGFSGIIKNKKIMKDVACFIALMFSLCYIYFIINYKLFYKVYQSFPYYFLAFLIIILGSILLIFLADTLSKYSLINGMSSLILAQYIIIFIRKYYDYKEKTKDVIFSFKDYKMEYFSLIVIMILVIFFNLYVKRIYITYPIKENLYHRYADLKINIPLKMNTSGMFSVLLTGFITPVIQFITKKDLTINEYIIIMFIVCFIYTFSQSNYKNIINIILKNNGDAVKNRYELKIENFIIINIILYSIITSIILCSIFALCEFASKLIVIDTGINIAALVIVFSNIILEIIQNIILNYKKDYYLAK